MVNSQPVKAEMSVATPKSQAKDPIQLDVVVVCRKEHIPALPRPTVTQAIVSAKAKIERLRIAGFDLSRNDRKIVIFGQLLTTLCSPEDAAHLAVHADATLIASQPVKPACRPSDQLLLFD